MSEADLTGLFTFCIGVLLLAAFGVPVALHLFAEWRAKR